MRYMVNKDRILTKPLNFTISKKVEFPISNENLIPIAKSLRKLSRMEHYLGICGGYTILEGTSVLLVQ